MPHYRLRYRSRWSSATRENLTESSKEHDVTLPGGVSVGEEDHVRPAVEAEGEIAMWQIAMKPGKPLAFGKVITKARCSRGFSVFSWLAGQSSIELRHFLAVCTPFLFEIARRA